MEISRIVTELLTDGTSGFAVNGEVEALKPPALPGLAFYKLWATEDGKSTGDYVDNAIPYWPRASGTRFLVVTWSAAESVDAPEGDPESLNAASDALLPGLMGAFEVDNPGWHTSNTIDYGVCLDGEMCLVLDDGREARITPGTVVVQRGTRHLWQNRSDKPATMLYVMVGAERSEI